MRRPLTVMICLLFCLTPSLGALEIEIDSAGSLWERSWQWLDDLTSELIAFVAASDDPAQDATDVGGGDEPGDPQDLKGAIVSSG